MQATSFATVSFHNVTDLVGTLAWPVVVVVAMILAVSDAGRRLLAPVLRRLKAISGPGGFGVELSPETAAATKSDVEGGLAAYAAALKRELDRLAQVESVPAILKTVSEDVTSNMASATRYRATVHMPDPLYSDTLYQLVDYWPAGKGSGRRFSTRFGMVGLAWRLEKSIYAGSVDPVEDNLIKGWGMTRDQAKYRGVGRQSFVCVILRADTVPVGVLYLDAEPPDAFPQEIVARLERDIYVGLLAKRVAGVRREIAKSGPELQLYPND